MADFSPATWTLRDIIAKVRSTTGRPDAVQMTDQTIVDYINKYYQYVMPKEIKTFYGYTYYSFFTIAGEDQYTPPDTTYQTYNPKVYIDGNPVNWYLSPDLFYQDYPIQENKTVVAMGDGMQFAFIFTTPAFPILLRSLYVTDGTQTYQDDGAGKFIGLPSSAINYATGLVYIPFPVAPAANVNITATCQNYVATRPGGILYYDNKFLLRGVPDNVYKVQMEGIKIPTALINYADIPYRTDMGPLIAFGASIEIFSDYNQLDQIQQIAEQYKRYKDISMQDTYEEYLYQRAVPTF